MNSPEHNARSEQQEIDATTRWPVLAFLGSAVLWLLAGGVLHLAASIQLHNPAFLADCAWLTHGRLMPAAQNALFYGWAMNAAFGIGLWLMARLSAAALRHGGWLLVAGKFWNLAVTLGILGILGGWSTSHELLEFPRYAVLLLIASYAMIAVWMVTTFGVRNTENVYATQWYLLAAALFFPWLYSIAQVMLLKAPVNGTIQAIVGAWYVNGIISLWLVPLSLAVAYYFLPKILGRPINQYYLAPLGFWWLIATGTLIAGIRLINAPVPVWIPTLGIASTFMLVMPILVVALNLFGTLGRDFGRAFSSPTLSFVTASVFSFLLWSVLLMVTSARGFAVNFQFTIGQSAVDQLAIYGCFSLAMFGAAYFVLPRVTGREWASGGLIKAHFWAAFLGLALYFVASMVGGHRQGAMLNDASVSFGDISRTLSSFLTLRSAAIALMLVGHVAFFINFAGMLVSMLSSDRKPVVFRNPPALSLPKAAGKEAHA